MTPNAPKDVLTEVARIIGLQLGIRGVRPQDRLLEDLGAESVDILNILLALEDRYGLVLNEGDLGYVRSVRELAGLVQDLLDGRFS